MRTLILSFAVAPLVLLFQTDARADFLLNCRLMNPGNPVYRQHCRENLEVVRIECGTQEECLTLKKLCLAGGEQALPDVGVSSSVKALSGSTSAPGNTLNGTATGSGGAVGGTVSGASGTIGGAISGAGSAVGGAVSGAGGAGGGAVSGAGAAVGGAVSP